MFTIEIDHDEVLVTILDENTIYEDVGVYIYDDLVYIKQWNEDLKRMECIQMSPYMFDEFMKAYHQPEGMFYVER